MRLLLNLAIIFYSAGGFARSLTASAPDWPPFFIHGSSDRKGFAWEIFSNCASAIDPNVTFENYPIHRMFRYMERGELDLNIMSFKKDRLASLAYGKEVLFENNYSVWTGAHIQRDIKKIEDLNQLTIGQMIGLRPSDQFRSWFEERLKDGERSKSYLLNEPEQVIKMLANGRIDATVISSPEIDWRAKRLGLREKIRDTNFSLQKQDYFFVIAKESPYFKRDPRLLDKLDACVRSLKQSEQWQRLQEKYEL